MAKCVIFDLDGTLADTSGDLIDAANACFRAMGAGDQLVYGADSPTAMRGGRAMLRLGLGRIKEDWTEDEVDQWYQPLLNAYEGSIDRHTRMFPGAVDAVEALTASGIAVGICTNKPEKLAEMLMTRLGVRDRFASLVGADTLPVRKPDPAHLFEAIDRAGGDRTKALLVGDTETDRKTSTAAGLPSVLVTFGPEGQDIARLNPDALLHRYEDLQGIVETLL